MVRREFIKNLDEFIFEKISNIIKEKNLHNILDFGCGSGELLKKLAREHPDKNFYGVDYFSLFGKKIDNENLNIKFIDKDGPEFESLFKNLSFELIITLFTLHHFKYPVKELQTIESLLEEDGTFFLLDHDFDNSNSELSMKNIHFFVMEICDAFQNKYHRHHYHVEEALDLMEATDLKVRNYDNPEVYASGKDKKDMFERSNRFFNGLEDLKNQAYNINNLLCRRFVLHNLDFSGEYLLKYGTDFKIFFIEACKSTQINKV
ncbi:MAG: class I SAM-dependent methyltransferase [Candidatus Muiribacteriota bacterium]